jgi:hypothetical protein
LDEDRYYINAQWNPNMTNPSHCIAVEYIINNAHINLSKEDIISMVEACGGVVYKSKYGVAYRNYMYFKKRMDAMNFLDTLSVTSKLLS